MTQEPHSALDLTQGRGLASCPVLSLWLLLARCLCHRAFLDEVAPVRWPLRPPCRCRCAKRRGQSLPAAASLRPAPPTRLTEVPPAPPLSDPPGGAKQTHFPVAQLRAPDQLDGKPRNTQHTEGKGAFASDVFPAPCWFSLPACAQRQGAGGCGLPTLFVL